MGEKSSRLLAALAKAVLSLAVCTASALCILCGMTNSTPFTARAESPEITLIAKFATYYGDSSDNRKHNIALAAKSIDGSVILPEDEFSFNDTVGARTEARGYLSAYIIQDGTFVEGVGGGVCQVSGTLYNCALLADLTITCVHPHSLPVSYVAPSFDSMVSSGSDLRFANTLSAPVTVRMTADGKYLRAEIYGVPSGFDIRRRSETLSTIPKQTEYVYDPALSPDEEVVDTWGKDGIKSEGWLEYFMDGLLVRTVRIRRDTYKPQKRIVRQGTLPENTDAPESDGSTLR